MALAKWLAVQIGMPATSFGIFVSGLFNCQFKCSGVGKGQHPAPNPSARAGGIVYVSTQAHHSIMKAMRILGYSVEVQLREIETNALLQIFVIH